MRGRFEDDQRRRLEDAARERSFLIWAGEVLYGQEAVAAAANIPGAAEMLEKITRSAHAAGWRNAKAARHS